MYNFPVGFEGAESLMGVQGLLNFEKLNTNLHFKLNASWISFSYNKTIDLSLTNNFQIGYFIYFIHNKFDLYRVPEIGLFADVRSQCQDGSQDHMFDILGIYDPYAVALITLV